MMDSESHFRTLEETGFHTSSEHPEFSSNAINVLDRLYEAENSGLNGLNLASAMQPFTLAANESQSQSQFDMVGHSIPVNSGVSLGSYELHHNHNPNEPLPPPQSPQFLNETNMFRVINSGLDAFTSPHPSQITELFTHATSPGSAGKVKCLICPKGSQVSIPISEMGRHIGSFHQANGAGSLRRNSPPLVQSSNSPKGLGSESRRNFVSKHFLLINQGENKGKKKCGICETVYSSTTSSSILSRHLSKVHHIDPKADNDPSILGMNLNHMEARSQRLAVAPKQVPSAKEKPAMKGPTPSQVWAHFSQMDVTNKDGIKFSVKKCHHCEKSYSVNTSNSGLARHLFSVHSIRLSCFVTVPPEDPDCSKVEEMQPEESSDKNQILPDKDTTRELLEPNDKEMFCDDLTGGFAIPDSNQIKAPSPQFDPMAPFFITETCVDGLIMSRKCRHCGRLFGADSTKYILSQHLSTSHEIHFQSFMGLEERGAAPMQLPMEPFAAESFTKGPRIEERNYRFLQILLSKFILTNCEPGEIIQNVYFQELIQCFDVFIKCPSLDECRVLASSLDGIRNLSEVPETESNPVWSHFLTQDSNRQCLYCHYTFPKATATFSLTRHLASAHPNLFPDGFPPPQRPESSESKTNAFHQLVARFLVTDLRPISFLEQELFQKFLVLLGCFESPISAQAISGAITRQYRDQFSKTESLLKSALSRVTLIVDLFDLKESGSMLNVTFSFVDCQWQPRRVLASANWYDHQLSQLDLEASVGVALYSFVRCHELQLRVACVMLNVRDRGTEFKGLLEQRLRERHNAAPPILRCVSGMLDESLLLALRDHPVSSRLQRVTGDLLLGRDWRDLQESLSNGKILLAEISASRENVIHNEWEELCFFLGRLDQVQRAAHSLYHSRHSTLSEVYVALKGLSDQLFDFMNTSQPQIGRLIESLSEFPSDSSEPLMHLATFLDPRFKLRVFGDRASTVLRLKKMLAAFPIRDDGSSHASAPSSKPTFSAVAASFFAPRPPFPELRVPQTLEEEFNVYLHLPPIEPQMNPLLWWSAHQIEFPIIHRIALEHLAIPATGHFLLPEQTKLSDFYLDGTDYLPILALWTHHRYS